jgi:hypothetical protein
VTEPESGKTRLSRQRIRKALIILSFILSFLGILLSLVTKTGIIPPMRFFTISELEDFVTRGNFQIVEMECLVPNPTEYFIVAGKT